MSAPSRTDSRPITAPIPRSTQRYSSIVEPDPVDIRCFMCMAECIQTWAALSNEGRVRMFCQERCLKEYTRINFTVEATRAPSPDTPPSPSTPPATRRVTVQNHKIPQTKSDPHRHIDLSKRSSPRAPLNLTPKKSDGKKVEDD